ncbi:unnamed protein product [Leptosia nina]|uniref:Uncharacterized protein n=1 Tax=Leptosia nina TaxID=320188 RepID=A0AAV1JK22_9NEOP
MSHSRLNLPILIIALLSVVKTKSEFVNENLYDSKNILSDSTIGLQRLINEKKFDENLVKSVGQNANVVNNYEEITVLDNGELKNLKYKSAKPKLPGNFKVTNRDSVRSSVKGKLDKTKSKFFDEIGCKYCSLLFQFTPFTSRRHGDYTML